MNESSDSWETLLDELVVAMSDDAFSNEQSAELQSLLETQPGARRRLAEAMHLSAMLGSTKVVDRSALQRSDRGAISDNRLDRRRFRTIATMLIGTCAAILAIMLWPKPQGVPSGTLVELFDEGVAVVTQSYDTQWSGDTRLQVGSSVSPGRVVLKSGHAQFEFYHGAVVVVEGPADLEFINASTMRCINGRLRAFIPPPAEGFTVLSAQFELVDLGTEFVLDVAKDGSSSVHVLDGEVELYKPDSNRSAASRHGIKEQNGATVSVSGEVSNADVRHDKFLSSNDLRSLSTERDALNYKRWSRHSDKLKSDPRVIAHYDFQPSSTSTRLLQGNEADNSLDGAVVGCTWAQGRWSNKRSLDYKHPGDRVRLHIPGEYQSLTYSAWVRLDRLFISLVLTNGYDVGEAHWQVRQDGRMLLGVKTPAGHVAYDSEPVLTIKDLGHWIHLVTVYDSNSQAVTHYIDGKQVGQSTIKTTGFPLTFGNMEIGNWGTPVTYSPQKKSATSTAASTNSPSSKPP